MPETFQPVSGIFFRFYFLVLLVCISQKVVDGLNGIEC